MDWPREVGCFTAKRSSEVLRSDCDVDVEWVCASLTRGCSRCRSIASLENPEQFQRRRRAGSGLGPSVWQWSKATPRTKRGEQVSAVRIFVWTQRLCRPAGLALLCERIRARGLWLTEPIIDGHDRKVQMRWPGPEVDLDSEVRRDCQSSLTACPPNWCRMAAKSLSA